MSKEIKLKVGLVFITCDINKVLECILTKNIFMSLYHSYITKLNLDVNTPNKLKTVLHD